MFDIQKDPSPKFERSVWMMRGDVFFQNGPDGQTLLYPTIMVAPGVQFGDLNLPTAFPSSFEFTPYDPEAVEKMTAENHRLMTHSKPDDYKRQVRLLAMTLLYKNTHQLVSSQSQIQANDMIGMFRDYHGWPCANRVTDHVARMTPDLTLVLKSSKVLVQPTT